MKKTLVSLAVLAASSASFAQVSITGDVAFGYIAQNVSGVESSGFGVDSAELFFNASEDLGGGSKVTSSLQVQNATSAGDVVLAYSTPVFSLTMAQAKGGDYLTGGVSGVGNAGLDDKITSARLMADGVTVSFPLTSEITLGFSHAEGAKLATGVGEGSGAAGTDLGDQRRNMISAKYVAGALVVDAGFGSYDQVGSAATNMKNQARGAVSYNFGAAKVGAGFDNRVYNLGTRTDLVAAVMVPVTPAFNAGVLFASRSHNDTNDITKDGTRSGYSIRANYNLSKQTSLNFDYKNYKAAFANQTNSTYAEVYMAKNF